ncbi:hypothetical protein [Synechococcus sp. LTW-R]|uniref:hypothetical protein n=1 Tax=Synechococcus sp. LTW-R TaxID=2751170 RepID=UPI001628BAD7|nr:hypothetical protein [Synechococcus sp. LTW-R]QNG28932.1 hypothetical protein H0O22_09275 [Synechococcus sp. LTW-R]
MLGSIVAFALGLNLPRSVLLSGIALAGHSAYLLLREKTRDKKFSPLRRVRSSFQGPYLETRGNQWPLVLVLLLIFGLLVTYSSLINGQGNISLTMEYLILIPICISLAASRLNHTTLRELTHLAIFYSAGSLVYVLACLIHTRSQGNFNLFALFFKQSHNELIAPWGHFNNAVNLRTIEQSLLFPISLLPVSIVAFARGKNKGTVWLFALISGTLSLSLSRAFNSHFPLVALCVSSALALTSLNSKYIQAKHFLLKQKKLITISAATLIATIAGSYLTAKSCIMIDERFSRAAEAIRHLPLLPQQGTGFLFSYQEACTNKTVTFASTAGDSLHNIFLDFSLQAGLIAGVSLFTCTALLTRRVFSKLFKSLNNNNQDDIGSTLEMSAAISMIGISWVLWLFQPVSSSNFSMFICSLYFLALCSSAVLTHPEEKPPSRLTN